MSFTSKIQGTYFLISKPRIFLGILSYVCFVCELESITPEFFEENNRFYRNTNNFYVSSNVFILFYFVFWWNFNFSIFFFTTCQLDIFLAFYFIFVLNFFKKIFYWPPHKKLVCFFKYFYFILLCFMVESNQSSPK